MFLSGYCLVQCNNDKIMGLDMRFATAAAMLLITGGCATVSMQPAVTTVSLTQAESQLVEASKAYCDHADQRGWVNVYSPMSLLQAGLFPENAPEKKAEYFTRINADSADSELLKARISSDVTSAADQLAEISFVAEAVLAEGAKPTRADVAGFERALVYAQKSKTSFEVATAKVAERGYTDLDVVQASMLTLDSEIVRARNIADRLVDAWQADTALTS